VSDQDDASKTEEPTSKRMSEAREQGNIPNSREMTSWLVLLGLTLYLAIAVSDGAHDLAKLMMKFIERPHEMSIDPGALQYMLYNVMRESIGMLSVPLGIALLMALIGPLGQVGLMFSSSTLEPKLDRIDPIQGFQRLFSTRALVEFAKACIKMVVVGAIIYAVIAPDFNRLPQFISMDPISFADETLAIAIKIMIAILFILAFLAAFDVFYQRYTHHQELRMTKQEVKDEFKQTEGDPMVKNRLRQIRADRARKRMMQNVPQADVVVTNPTHFAVALKYDQETMHAPRLTAKGADLIAKRIRDIAEENNVPLVENPPLARALYASVELDQEVPPEHYQAVAEVIGYIMRLKRGPARS
jgi:flagellar biosynthesis protein FlhB